MSSKKQSAEGSKLIAANKKAHFDYFIMEKLEVGIELRGSELRPCREGRVNLKDSYVDEENGQFWLYDVHIGSNPFSNRNDHEPERKRRLLAHKSQIIKWGQKVKTSGMTIVPLRMYFTDGKVKLEIALVKGKAQYDKRDAIAKKDAKRDLERELGGRR
ncbi:MAG: SsrA-binding protein SmpB [Candidatus Riflebacteria bacterium]|nr:SsrA-binding protein SmpB [Candidatus Riflebacteria bacterium]MDD3376191.1 SsrA-binding protein SmpB [Candidatus Riflebacteria bacterium]NLV93096.1 SsrA-binding protein SmpB [Candidatus Riflebacteria bacterium]